MCRFCYIEKINKNINNKIHILLISDLENKIKLLDIERRNNLNLPSIYNRILLILKIWWIKNCLTDHELGEDLRLAFNRGIIFSFFIILMILIFAFAAKS